MAKISEQDLKAIVDAELDAAMGYLGAGELSGDRSEAMDRYLGEAFNEMEGRSTVQTRDVMDVIEWILPSLIRIFTDTDSAVTFEPVGPQDEQQAEQETDYINYLFYKKNPGFLILYTWFKDALLQKNGIVKAYPEEDEDVSRETYQYLTDEEFTALNSDPDNELIEHETETVRNDPLGEVTVHNATFLRKETKKNICIENVAPEDFLISTDIRSVNPKKARFTAERQLITVSELKESGYSDDDIALMKDGPDLAMTPEQVSRRNLTDEQQTDTDVNEAMKTKEVFDCYLKADRNGDGVAEMLNIKRSGDFLEAEEIDDSPFYAITPIILTHKFFGLSVADIIKDIQEIKTTLLRSFFDNIYQNINGTIYYNENTVNVEDLLSSSPWGLRAVNGQPGAEVMHVNSMGFPQSAFDLFELMDGLKQQRIGDFQAQVDPTLLANAQTGVIMRMTMEAKAKTEMIARIFAETGVRELFRGLHELTRKYMDKETVVRLRGMWVPVNPSDWRERTDMTVKVGLGNTTKEEKVETAMAIMAQQMQLAQGGVVMPQNLYESAADYLKALGKKNPDKYVTNPATVPPQPPPPDPQMAAVQASLQIEQIRQAATREQNQMQAQLKATDQQLEHMRLVVQQQQNDASNQLKHLQVMVDELNQRAKLTNDSNANELKKQAMALDAELQRIQAIQNQYNEQNQILLSKYQTDVQSQTQLVLAEVKKTSEGTQQAENAQAKLMASLTDSLQALSTKLEEMDAPKEVIRDAMGRISAIGKRKVNRDAQGRVISVG